jgi:hypothetical protein
MTPSTTMCQNERATTPLRIRRTLLESLRVSAASAAVDLDFGGTCVAPGRAIGIEAENVTGHGLVPRRTVNVGLRNAAIMNGEEDLSVWDDEELKRGRGRDKHGGWRGSTPSNSSRAGSLTSSSSPSTSPISGTDGARDDVHVAPGLDRPRRHP